MATVLDVTSFDRADENKCHLLPCKLKYNGDAKVSEYFESSIRRTTDNGSEQLTSSLRGRPLNGEEISVPHAYTGVILKENRKPVIEDEERNLVVTGKFKVMTYWNLDKVPTADDHLRQAMGWIDIAKALHRPVQEESSQMSVTGK
ncbi:hypothetical protein ScPMuIL_014217 [Solemya velum]